jgi:hypothetical protein
MSCAAAYKMGRPSKRNLSSNKQPRGTPLRELKPFGLRKWRFGKIEGSLSNNQTVELVMFVNNSIYLC